MAGHDIISHTNLPIRTAQDPSGNTHKPEDHREDSVGLQGEDEEGEERKAPDDQIKSESRVVCPTCGASAGEVGCS